MDNGPINRPSTPAGFTEKIGIKSELVQEKDKLFNAIHTAEQKLQKLTSNYQTVKSRIQGVDRSFKPIRDKHGSTFKKLKSIESSLAKEISALSEDIKANQKAFDSLDSKIQDLTKEMLKEIESYDKQMATMDKVDTQVQVLSIPKSDAKPLKERKIVENRVEPSRVLLPIATDTRKELAQIKKKNEGLNDPEVKAFVDKYIDTKEADKIVDLAKHLTKLGKPEDAVQIAKMFIKLDKAEHGVDIAKILDDHQYLHFSLKVSTLLELSGKTSLTEVSLKNSFTEVFKNAQVTLTNLFLDKAKVPHLVSKVSSTVNEKTVEENEGWVGAFADAAVAKGLHRLPKSENFKQLGQSSQKLVGNLAALLTDSSEMFFEYTYASKLKQYDPFTEKIVAQVKGLNQGANHGSVVFPFGVQGHATKLMVTKQKNGNYTATLYNTGSGLEKHSKIQVGNRYRYKTFVTHKDISPLVIEKKENWRGFLDCLGKSDEGLLYDSFNNLAGKDEIQEDSNVPEEFYELDQQHGTCTVQSTLALIRHAVLSQETPLQENFADYKLLKALLDQSLWKNMEDEPGSQAKLAEVDQGIKDYALSKIERSSRHIMIAKIAADEDLFIRSLEQYGPTIGLTPDDANDFIDSHSRFKLVELLVKNVFVDWASKGVADTSKLDPELAEPVLALYNTRRKDADALIHTLDDYLKKGPEAYEGNDLTNDFIKTLNTLYSTGFISDVIDIGLRAFESNHLDQNNEYLLQYKAMILD
ncbi:MAG: hypothetical protein VX777_02255 [Chlamydiota bacterium]|nr:hypothetical protein [Chlamydiota bacterium]